MKKFLTVSDILDYIDEANKTIDPTYWIVRDDRGNHNWYKNIPIAILMMQSDVTVMQQNGSKEFMVSYLL